jgi:hypothetical protein
MPKPKKPAASKPAPGRGTRRPARGQAAEEALDRLATRKAGGKAKSGKSAPAGGGRNADRRR